MEGSIFVESLENKTWNSTMEAWFQDDEYRISIGVMFSMFSF